MFKKDRTLFVTIISMLIIIISIILVIFIYERKNDSYINEIKTKEKYLDTLKDSHEALEDEVEKLNNEIEELNRIKRENIPSDGNMATYYQSMIELSDISFMIKEGKIKEAKEELLKINPSGFDFTALSFYESLCRELKIEK